MCSGATVAARRSSATVGSLAALPLWTMTIRGALGKRNGF
jgi:hypothetical protein